MQTRIRPFRSHRILTSFASAALVACAAFVRAGDLIVEGSLTVETNLTVQGRTTLDGRLNLGGNDVTNAGIVRAVRFVGDGGGLTNCVDDAAQDLALKLQHYGTAEIAITPASQFTRTGLGVITGYVGSDPDVVVPYEANGTPIRSIGANAFRNNQVVRSLVLPNCVTNLENCAFLGCSNLVTVVLGDGLVRLSTSAFNGCKSLERIALPESVESMGPAVFSGCSALSHVDLGNRITTLPIAAFRYCANLETITIPQSVTNILPIAFLSCSNLVEVAFAGDCPTAIDSIYTSASNVVNYVSAEASGWGTEFCGRPVVRPDLTADALRATSLQVETIQVTYPASEPRDAVNYQTLTNHLRTAAYVRNVVNGGTSGTTGEVMRAGDIVTVRFPASSANAFAADGSVPLTGNLLFAGGPRAIAPTTLDGADNSFTAISGGGVVTALYDIVDTSRGATVWTIGNESEAYPGQLWLSGGHASGAVDAGAIIVTTADDGNTYRRRLVIDPAAPASFEGDRVANVGDAVDDLDAVNRRSAQAMIAAALQAVGPFGDVSMGCYTNRP